MGLFDIFKKKDAQSAQTGLDAFPDITGYRAFLFLKTENIEALEAHCKEYGEIYPDEIVFTPAFQKYKDPAWVCMSLTPVAGKADAASIWHYLNLLLWMSDKAEKSFAYAVSGAMAPVFAERDWSNSFGDSVMGIANGKNYYCNIPEQSVKWRQSVAKGFDPVQHIRERYGVDVTGI